MHHHMIAISPTLPWSTLGERLAGEPSGLSALPADYVAREEAFLDVARLFLARIGAQRRLTYRFITVFDEFPNRRDDAIHSLVYHDLGSDEDIRRALAEPSFAALPADDQLRIFRLAARDLLAVCVESDDGVRLSTMDDGFYWFVSLPRDCPPTMLVPTSNAVIIDSIDVFDPA